MSPMHYLPALAALVVSHASLWLLLSPPGRRLLLDRPNARSLHERPVPRSGGIAIAAGVAAGAALGNAVAGTIGAVLGVAGALAVLFLADDIFTLPTLLRLAAHLAAAAAAVGLVIGVSAPFPFVLLVLAVAWYANLYNFMDGSDGLAGGMAVFGFGAYAWATSARCHSAFSPARLACWAGAKALGRCGFRSSYSRRSCATRRSRW